MLSKRYYYNEKTNNLLWNLDKFLGHAFEDHIADVLKGQLSPFHDLGVKVITTPGSRDDGKDIIITSKIDLLNVLENDFYVGDFDYMKIYIECKSSNEHPISFNDITGNIDRICNENINYFVLVTNTTIMPYTYYMIECKCKQCNIKFILVDQYILFKYLTNQDSMIGTIDSVFLKPNIYVEYQILTYGDKDIESCELFFLLRNYKDTVEKININLISDRNWELDENELFSIILHNQCSGVKTKVHKKYHDGVDKLSFLLKTQRSEQVMEINGVDFSNDFSPDFIGKEHKRIIDKLTLSIKSNKFFMYYLIGEAGTGKTRIIDEIQKELDGSNISILRIICTKNEWLINHKICTFLLKNNFIKKINEDYNLADVLNSIDNKYKKCLIILDDSHNMSSLLETMQEVYKLKSPDNLKIVLIGRNDYSAGNIKYFNFLEWCKNKNVKGNILNSMDDEDTSIFIKTLIPDVPEVVFTKIMKLSNNNPLFIIQFIEYLLEINLAVIMNRNLISICNVDTFSSLSYLPQKIEDLYKKRCDNLIQDNPECMEFLYIYAMLGIQIPQYKLLCYFETNQDKLKILVKRKFISFQDDSTTNIIHESLYIYINKQLLSKERLRKSIAKKILSTSYLKDGLTELELGQLYFYAGEKNLAEKNFAAIIKFCGNLNNYTAINMNIEYFDYLDSVYNINSKNQDIELLRNILICKVYTALHYFTPVRAIIECEDIEKKVKKLPSLNNNNRFLSNISALKAHSCVNAGRLKLAEKFYMQLLTKYILNNDSLDEKSSFDMYDRLSGLYIRYNMYTVAENFNKLATFIAKEIKSDTLLGLTEITKAKLELYSDFEKSYSHLIIAKAFLENTGVHRNISHNNITITAYKIIMNRDNIDVLNEIRAQLKSYLDEALKNAYPSSVIRCYLILSIVDFCINEDKYSRASEWIRNGINSSIQHGIASYIWMFYNLKFIIATKLNKPPQDIAILTEIIFKLLKQQNLLQATESKLTYSNILVLTNILKFNSQYEFEKSFYRKLSQIDISERSSNCDFNCEKEDCQYSCATDINLYKKQYNRVKTGKIIFTDNYSYDFIDKDTGYFIVFA